MQDEESPRIVSGKLGPEDTTLDANLRPKKLGDFIGQQKVKDNLDIGIKAAQKRGEAIDHILLYGPPGLGKTTLAFIIASEMGVNIKVSSGPAIERPADLAIELSKLKDGEILFIDEVLAVGDLAFQEKCLGKMSEVAGHGRTVVFVSHNMGAISALCPDVLWLDEGRVRMMGKTSEVVPEFVRASGRNFSVGEMVIESDERREAQVSRVRILSPDGQVTTISECSDALTIEMLLDVRRSLPGLYAYLEVRHPDGIAIMVSDSYDTTPNPLDGLTVGRHRVTATIPARTLGPGKYDVYLNLTGISGSEFNVHSPDVVGSFRLYDSQSARGNARTGFFSTLLDWRATPVPPGEE